MERKKRVTNLELFKERMEEIHGKGHYDFTESVYTNSKVPITVKCIITGDFITKPPSFHFQTVNCKACWITGRYSKRAKRDYGKFIDAKSK